MHQSDRRHSTGLEILDRRLDGGIPVGTLVALVAPPESQSELFLEAMGRHRPVTFVSTTCSRSVEARRRYGTDGGEDAGVRHVHASASELVGSGNSPPAGQSGLAGIDEDSFVIVDPGNDLERETRADYHEFLADLVERLEETGSVGIIHLLEEDSSPRNRWLTLKTADHVWQLELTPTSQDIRNRLLVTKSRGYRALTEPIPLVLTDRIRIDTSRSIG